MRAAQLLAQPAAVCVMAAAGILFCLALFVTVKLELHAAVARLRRREAELAASLAELRTGQESLSNRIEAVQRDTGLLAPPPAPRSGMNLSTRSQALRLYRRGDTVESIAAALDIPRQEVELLVKVQQVVMQNL